MAGVMQVWESCFVWCNCTEGQAAFGAETSRTNGFNTEVTESTEFAEEKEGRNSWLKTSWLQDGAGFGDVGVEGFDDGGVLLFDDAALEL
jgi:hypothetical protein